MDRIVLLWAAGFVVLMYGCSSHVSYDTLEEYIHSGDCEAAAALMADSESDYGGNSVLLFLLDSAMVHMKCRNFEAAQEKFRAAEDLSEALWTLSLSRELSSLITNDYALEYPGEDFERAMIHLMSALAFLDEGKPEEALVECRRLDSLLVLFNDKYDKKNVYKEDAFGRYLSGILREQDHDWSGAFIDYKKALAAYESYGKYYGTDVPEDLKLALVRTGKIAGRLEEAEMILPDYSGLDVGGETGTLGQVVWVQLEGRVPEKIEDRVIVPTRHGPLTIAFPKFAPSPPPGPGSILELVSGTGEQIVTSMDLVSDLAAIARKNLEDRKARVTAKALARAVAKQTVIREIAKNDNKETQRAVENLLNFLNLLLEQADLRSWKSLPGRIYMARVFLPPGEWEAVLDSGGGNIQKKLLVKAGQLRYIIVNDSLERAFQ